VVLALGLSFRPEWMCHHRPGRHAHQPLGSRWQARYQGQPARSGFTDDGNGFLVGTTAESWKNRGWRRQLQERSRRTLTSATGDNYLGPVLKRLNFKGQEGWIAGQPGLHAAHGDGGKELGAPAA